MLIRDWGEEGFINYLRAQFPVKEGTVGIGDDCAVIPRENGESLLITTDALVEGIHFIKNQISPEDLGYKTIAVNVSDMIAMGGTPKQALLSIALPSSIDSAWLKGVIQGINEACVKWNVQLVGGDTVGSQRDLFLNLTLLGSAPPSRIKYRHSAKENDILCVSGYLGDSGGGFKALQESIERLSLIESHCHPNPSLEEGLFLASELGVRAMMDLSDGLDCDLQRLILASHCGAVVELSAIPLSNTLQHTCKEQKWDALKLALSGGEDYCLLLTIAPDAYDSIQQRFSEKFDHPLYKIGKITKGPQKVCYEKEGKSVELSLTRYTPFH